MAKKKTPAAGHNANAIAVDQLRSIIDRWEHLQEEKKDLSSDQKDIMAEAKGAGFDTRAIRRIIRTRAADPETLAEVIAIENAYREALGMEALDL